MLILFVTMWLVIGGVVYAGINFSNQAMTAEEYYKDYKLPVFKNRQEAIIWAHKQKWIEPVRRLLIKRMAELMELADLNFPGKRQPTLDEIAKAKVYMEQFEDYKAALFIVEQYKKAGVGAVVYSSSEVVR